MAVADNHLRSNHANRTRALSHYVLLGRREILRSWGVAAKKNHSLGGLQRTWSLACPGPAPRERYTAFANEDEGSRYTCPDNLAWKMVPRSFALPGHG